MARNKLVGLGILIGIIVIGFVIVMVPPMTNNSMISNVANFPDFYTKTDDYFVANIGEVPEIDENSYELRITGWIDNPRSYSLSELYALPFVEFPLTVECIGNPSSGPLLSTANWSGFNIYDILTSLGLKSNATGVKYYAEDGYYVTHTMEQLINNSVIGALYINELPLPPVQGFPLRIINPGFYGAKQIAWVTEIQVIDMPLTDYWDDRGWDTSPRMPVDSNIFFAENFQSASNGSSILVGGAAYGGERISKVEYTLNDGLEWDLAEIVKSVDFDNVWIFWLANITINELGTTRFYVKATDIYNRTQPKNDPIKNDGDNSWAFVDINII
ncbi:MAG: molybdopterin-dependent oxidoreductase [Candidatus Lokiarchaeota archaeon]|nr:molybdopterin-dependent oxidoreductase [Candidatus Lokiarchaeota archaeon]